jgi:apolipoprotein D and lipocalin family protein
LKIFTFIVLGLCAVLLAGAFLRFPSLREIARNMLTKEYELKTAENVDLNKYLGTWYSLYEFPAWFQEGCTCTKAEYALNADGSVRVTNSCIKGEELSSAEAVAVPIQAGDNSKLSVKFNRFAKGKYYIISVDSGYRVALVGAPDRNYLWILSRDKTLDAQSLDALKLKAEEQGFDTKKLHKVEQACQ